ncbi:uncharacterized protein (TIGR02271 family) [Curtobacterium sp. PhB25]|uniref:YsnF/AvaK domain-containing protein n=1 Tax=Curtobacterium sp. PhB25 TaxID=2485205 RepID=UPI001066EC9D|nr:YsnF/AvaK domain-containing protein [Curtobacterium sp. PhB25]TDW67911.1 uncharacterized protein (TIGR02271 family) [Curtobacterium sp. PhB25]
MTSRHAPRDAPGGDERTDQFDVVRRDERLVIGTERHAIERVRLERVIVTEQRTITVDVSHEEIRLVREPIGDAVPVSTGTTGTVHEPIVVVLREEQITVSTAVVPVERVTLTTHTVTEEHRVEAELRREEIDIVTSRRRAGGAPLP